MAEQIMKWHQDGHSFIVVLDKTLVMIEEFHCPSRGAESEACQLDGECIVERFVTEYGFDCNVGVANVNGRVEIAWTLVGDTKDKDSCQVWFIPTQDEFFAAWATSQKNESRQED